MHIQKYTLLLTAFIACSSIAVDKKDPFSRNILNESSSSTTTSSLPDELRQVLLNLSKPFDESKSLSSASEPSEVRRRVLEPRAVQDIAKDLYDKAQALSAISSYEARPANVSKYIIEQIDILDITCPDQDDIFDAFMLLHTLEHTITTTSKMIHYALSQRGDRIAYAEQAEKSITLHVDHCNDKGVWSSWSSSDMCLEALTQIYWSNNDDLYTMHSKRESTNARMIEWKETIKASYQIDTEYVSQDWRAFYKKHSIITNPEQKPALPAIEKKDDLHLTIRTQVSSVPMMVTYLEQNYQRRLQQGAVAE